MLTRLLPQGGVNPWARRIADGRTAHRRAVRHARAAPWQYVGQADLMGFSVFLAEPGGFFSSGHPGQGLDLHHPVGLIVNRDGGRTWQPAAYVAGERDAVAFITVHPQAPRRLAKRATCPVGVQWAQGTWRTLPGKRGESCARTVQLLCRGVPAVRSGVRTLCHRLPASPRCERPQSLHPSPPGLC